MHSRRLSDGAPVQRDVRGAAEAIALENESVANAVLLLVEALFFDSSPKGA